MLILRIHAIVRLYRGNKEALDDTTAALVYPDYTRFEILVVMKDSRVTYFTVGAVRGGPEGAVRVG
jgi:hypothetical protein